MVTLRRRRGFTLPELMAAVAIGTILAAVAVPSFTELIAGQRGKTAASDLFASLMQTRSEALKRNTAVTLARSGDGWQSGWRIAHPNDADIILHDHGPIIGATISGPATVTFLANGRIRGGAAPSFGIAVDGAEKLRCISVDLSGRPYQKPSAC